MSIIRYCRVLFSALVKVRLLSFILPPLCYPLYVSSLRDMGHLRELPELSFHAASPLRGALLAKLSSFRAHPVDASER
jgi:hypothetical protein